MHDSGSFMEHLRVPIGRRCWRRRSGVELVVQDPNEGPPEQLLARIGQARIWKSKATKVSGTARATKGSVAGTVE